MKVARTLQRIRSYEEVTMLKSSHVGAIVFYTSNMARAEKFYRDTLGLDVHVNREYGSPMMVAQSGQVELLFFEKQGARTGDSPVVIFILDEGIDDIIEQLVKEGVEIVTPVSEGGGGWVADFKDPDQNMLGFWQSQKKPRRKK
jgi:glyoxylase I family protein